MNSKDIEKMQEIASRLTRVQSLKWMCNREEIINAKMKELRQQEMAENEILLEELPDEIRAEVFMILQ